jgi:S1-C subfamily serine protease/tRNA A-37 threonylcarbamoyl transferase component Bud32
MPANPGTHPSANTLRSFGLGKLDDATAEKVARHLESCPGCRQELTALSGDGFLDRLRDAQARSGSNLPFRSLLGNAKGLQANRSPQSLLPAVANLPPELANNLQYHVVRELGRGGMGVVYLAKNVLMDRLEVLKVVSRPLLDAPTAAERFLREIRSAAKLSHDNVVKAYSALTLGELLVFAMEYVEGEDLAQVVKQHGPLSVPRACFYAQQAALGLQHAHEHGMVHRDIKPHNLILSRQGKKHVVKVLDFGLAKATREGKADTGLTGPGMVMGTPDYIAPEQAMDAASADIRADVYSLGCTLYFLLTGAPPFQGKSVMEILQAHLFQEARPVNQGRDDVPAELAAVVAKMMAKEPPRRFPKPIEVALALAPFVKLGVKLGPAGAARTEVGRTEKGARLEQSRPAEVAVGWEDLVTEGAEVHRPKRVVVNEDDEEDDRPRRKGTKPAGVSGLVLGLSISGGVLFLALVIVLLVVLSQSGKDTSEQAARSNNTQTDQPPINQSPINQPPINQPPINQPPVEIIRPVTQKGGLSNEVLDLVKQATVLIRVTRQGGSRSSVSGFFVSDSGLVITHAQVFSMLDQMLPTRVEVVLNSNLGADLEKVLLAKVIAIDRTTNLAVLKPTLAPGVNRPTGLAVNPAKELQETQELFIAGFPFGEKLGKNLAISKTSVSSVRKDPSGLVERVQVNGGIHPGNSGGPVIDSRGNVVGVAAAGIEGTQSNFAIPGELVQAVLDGRPSEITTEEPFVRGGRIVVRVKIRTIDPLQRIQRVAVDWWFGDRNLKVPSSTTQPTGGPTRQTVPVAYDANFQSGTAELQMQSVPPSGQVLWVQASYVNATGQARWMAGVSRSIPSRPK